MDAISIGSGTIVEVGPGLEARTSSYANNPRLQQMVADGRPALTIDFDTTSLGTVSHGAAMKMDIHEFASLEEMKNTIGFGAFFNVFGDLRSGISDATVAVDMLRRLRDTLTLDGLYLIAESLTPKKVSFLKELHPQTEGLNIEIVEGEAVIVRTLLGLGYTKTFAETFARSDILYERIQEIFKRRPKAWMNVFPTYESITHASVRAEYGEPFLVIMRK
ncbi:MAG: hypothetical protein RI911_240 [Candidatus Parcubacteria bacterium]|jgi:hypothetical protein